MPARSNDFQRLVFLVKKVLAPTNATVTESKFLTDRMTGERCEVDVCIEDEFTGHSRTLCVEVRDRSRPASVEWVREMRGKHQHLPTDRLVLASRSGFSKTARRDAEQAGIDLLAYKNITEQDVENTLGHTLFAKSYQLAATKVVGILPATEALAAERVELSPKYHCFDQDGTVLGNVLQLVHAVLKDRRLAEKFAQEGTEAHQYFAVAIDVPRLASGGRVCL